MCEFLCTIFFSHKKLFSSHISSEEERFHHFIKKQYKNLVMNPVHFGREKIPPSENKDYHYGYMRFNGYIDTKNIEGNWDTFRLIRLPFFDQAFMLFFSYFYELLWRGAFKMGEYEIQAFICKLSLCFLPFDIIFFGETEIGKDIILRSSCARTYKLTWK